MTLALDILTRLYPEKMIPASGEAFKIRYDMRKPFEYDFFDCGILWALARPKEIITVTDLLMLNGYWQRYNVVVIADITGVHRIKDHQFIMLKMAEINFVRSGTLLNVPGLVGKPSTMNDVAKRVEKKPVQKRKGKQKSPPVSPVKSKPETKPVVKRSISSEPSDCPF